MKFITAYGPKTVSNYTEKLKTLTEQSHKQMSDTTHIVTSFLKTGVTDHLNVRQPIYDNYPSVDDYKSLMDTIAHGNSVFEQLPVATRQRFDYDAAEYFEFATNPKNLPELRKMGLATPYTELSSDYVAPTVSDPIKTETSPLKDA